MNYLGELLTFEVDNVPMDETQTVDMGTTESDRKFYPIELVIISKEAPGSIGLCTMSVGTNASSYNNVTPATLLLSLNQANRAFKIDTPATVDAIPGNTAIKAKISIAASNGGLMRIVLIGVYGDYEI